jgi:uncharacterized protein
VNRRPDPPVTDLTEPFWEATRDRRYLVQWCTACDRPIFYPREVCPACLSPDSLTWRQSGGTGTVYAVSVQYRPADPSMADRVPYAVALIDLDAGDGDATVRIMSNVVNCQPAAVAVGEAVGLTWEPLADGRNLPQFEPAAEPRGDR